MGACCTAEPVAQSQDSSSNSNFTSTTMKKHQNVDEHGVPIISAAKQKQMKQTINKEIAQGKYKLQQKKKEKQQLGKLIHNVTVSTLNPPSDVKYKTIGVIMDYSVHNHRSNIQYKTPVNFGEKGIENLKMICLKRGGNAIFGLNLSFFGEYGEKVVVYGTCVKILNGENVNVNEIGMDYGNDNNYSSNNYNGSNVLLSTDDNGPPPPPSYNQANENEGKDQYTMQ